MSEIKTLLPHTANSFDRDLETVTAERIEALGNPLRDLWNVDTCPAHLLPWLAWAFSVEVWGSDWPETVKREVIRNAIKVHRIKGTRQAVEVALASLNMRIDLHEGFELDEGGAPYGPAHTFLLDVFGADIFDAGFQIDAKLHSLITKLIYNVKPVHVHFVLRIGEARGGTVMVRTGSLQRAEDHRHITPALPVDTHAPRLAARTGHRARAILREIHRFEMGEAA